MRKRSTAVAVLAAAIIMVLMYSVASAQLIMHDARYLVVRVDPQRNRVELTTLCCNPWRTVRYAEITPHTQVVTADGRVLPWTSLQHGWLIRVRGGVTWGMNITTDQIVVLDTNPNPQRLREEHGL